MEFGYEHFQKTRRTGEIILIFKLLNMQSITKTYLTDIIFRTINQTIQIRRASQSNHLYYLRYAIATNEELYDFIQSIPYFDERLKCFLIGKLNDTTIIISQTWETSFIIKIKAWAESDIWLHTDPIFSIGFYPEYIPKQKDFLTLPY